jgi:hypothetical protein
MAEIINIFSKKRVQNDPTTQQQINPLVTITKADIEASQNYNFREVWVRSLHFQKMQGIDFTKHHVTLADTGKAISIAAVLRDDKEAVEYFLWLATKMTTTKQFYVELGTIPDYLRGYVWAPDFQIIINAAAFAEYQLSSIIGTPITRHIFF